MYQNMHCEIYLPIRELFSIKLILRMHIKAETTKSHNSSYIFSVKLLSNLKL